MRLFAIMLAVAAAGACSKDKKDPGEDMPSADEWHDPAAVPSPGGPGGGDPHAGMAMGGDPHAGMDMGGDPHAGMDMGGGGVDVTALGLDSPDPAREIDPTKFLKGTIKPSDATASRISKGQAIFISVKRAGAKDEPVGMPLAVDVLRYDTWPAWFHVTEENQMVAGTEGFTGKVVITAWADQDGDAISKMPGDVLGTAVATIPAEDIQLTLDTVVE